MEEYTVDTVSPFEYAHIGNYAFCPIYSLGCPSCPHVTLDPIMSGSPTVLIDGFPAARVGDTGLAGGGCGSAEFVIAEGDHDVLIDGMPAARFGDRTDHAGGVGEVVRTLGVPINGEGDHASSSSTEVITYPALAETRTFQITLTLKDSDTSPYWGGGGIFVGGFEGNTFKGTTDVERENITMWKHTTGECAVTVLPTSDPAIWEITDFSMHLITNHDRGVKECYISGNTAMELIGPSEFGICQIYTIRGDDTCKYINNFDYTEKDNDGNTIKKVEQCPCNEYSSLSIHTGQ